MITIRSLAVAATVLAAGILAVTPSSAAAVAAQARGIGATFPEPAYTRWGRLFSAETGERVAYEGSGSGAGVTAIETGSVTFGATDTPLDDAALGSHGLVQFPTLVGGVVPVVNVPGVGPGDMILDGQSLADLFGGRIAFWDDPAILARNPHLPLPHLAVAPVRRSDVSGTTATFAAYLAKTSRGWDEWLGQAPPVLRPVGLLAQGSEGIADTVSATPGAIGYLGFDVAQVHRLTYPDLVNGAGRVVQPTLASIAAAAAGADWAHGLTPSLVARPGVASWPIVTCTYVLMRRVNADDLAAWTALKFFGWAFRYGGPSAEDLGFVPLPARVETEVRRLLLDVHDTSGRSLAPPDVTNPTPGADH